MLSRVQPSATARSCRVHAKQQELEHLKGILQQVQTDPAMSGADKVLEDLQTMKPLTQLLPAALLKVPRVLPDGGPQRWAGAKAGSQAGRAPGSC